MVLASDCYNPRTSPTEDTAADVRASEGQSAPEISDKMTCSACGCSFDSREEQTEHYKLDWHRFNLRQKLMGAQSVTAEGFERIAGDVSSISGSDSDEWDSYADLEGLDFHSTQHVSSAVSREHPVEERSPCRYHPRILFRSVEGEYLSVYRCILQGKQMSGEDENSFLASLLSLSPETVWVILMTGGGHFAGAVFRGDVVIQHKTFHRYTVRAKRGVAQGVRDGQNRSHAPKSAGASMRRYNEAALVKDIEDLLLSWSDFLEEARAIFLRAPSYNRGIFFSSRVPVLKRGDNRLNSIPFTTRRATFTEVKRVHAALSTVDIYPRDTDVTTILSPQRSPWKMKAKAVKDLQVSIGDECEDMAIDVAELPSSLEMVEEALGTLDLREFEVTPKKKRRKKKKVAAEKMTVQQDPDVAETAHNTILAAVDPGAEPVLTGGRTKGKKRRILAAVPAGTSEQGSESYQVRDELYTACRSGEMESLRRLLHHLLPAPILDPCCSGPAPTSDPGAACRPDTQAQIRHQADGSEGPETADSNRGSQTQNADGSGGLEMEHSSRGPLNAGGSRGLQTQTAGGIQTVDGDGAGGSGGVGRDHPEVLASVGVTAAMLREPVDESGFTLLHVAAAAAKGPILGLLLDAGCDPALRDKHGQSAYAVSADRETRNEFRRYMAKHSGRYNYVKAQISVPLTCEMESRQAERRQAQRAARKVREKERKEEARRQQKEEIERRRFTALSDREKRAITAEERFAQQLVSAGTGQRIRRCWLCGQSLVGRVPFEYLDYSFCTTRCLQQHRRQHRQ
ncbi:tRNA endonuclease ANKZF1 isoform X3 [Narcine bancroftii]|uniref:tRNA endonuclease ANKZF1 isoform X3 n=1 Tax=Narcine bancroftii TaxID=1343680 RepID=UPI003831E663